MAMRADKGAGGWTRRQFLARSGLLLGSVGALQAVGASGFGRADSLAPAKSAGSQLPWEALREEISGGILRPGESGYAKAAASWNLGYPKPLPAAVARCQSATDVQNAIFWAQSHRVPLVGRSGGLSYGGSSLTAGLLLDLAAMNAVVFDAESGVISAGGGARMSDLYAPLEAAGVAITHGRCPRLGLAGMVLGGGLGLNMRQHGLTCDQLLETEIVTADGALKTCSREENTDLFWACRGAGGGNFGINTLFKLQTFPVDRVTVFDLAWSTDIEDILPLLLSLLPQVDHRVGAEVTVRMAGSGILTLSLLGQYDGPMEELMTILDPAFQIAAPQVESVEELPYWEGQERIQQQGKPSHVRVRSRFAYSELPIQAADLVVDALRHWPGTSLDVCWKAYLTGGAIDSLNRRSTAYVHRGATMLTSIELTWGGKDSSDRIDRSLAWMDDLHQAMGSFTSLESYQNFVDPSEEHFLQAYYAENSTYLVALKRRFDPQQTFRSRQGLPTYLDT